MKNPFLLGFCALNISSLLWPVLLPWPMSLLLLLGAVALFKRLPLLAGGLAGTAWVCLYATLIFDYRALGDSEQTWIRAEIIASVSSGSDWQSIDIRLVKPKLISPFAAQMRLNWRTNEQIRPGQVWDFRIERRAINSNLNQGGFNGQRYLLSKHIGLKGRVIAARAVSTAPAMRTVLIERLNNAFEDSGDKAAEPALLLALLGGEQGQITPTQWQQLRQTGTGHLMAISGLHMSVLALWLYGAVRFLLLRIRPRPDRQNLLIAMAVAALGCLLYGLLAGMGIPTRRAFIMLAMLMLLSLSRRFASPWERLLYALSAVLLLDPLSPLSAGFWLSFGAIGIILMVVTGAERQRAAMAGTSQAGACGRLKMTAAHYLVSLIKIQLALSLGLGFVQLVLFGGVSLHSLWINLLMVPWFSLLVIPLALMGLLLFLLLLPLGLASGALFSPAIWALAPFGALLELSDRLPLAWVSVADSLIAPVLFAIAAICLFWLPISKGLRAVSACLLLPLLLQLSLKPGPQTELHLVDVGQGLAAVVFAGDKTLVYDTGSAYGSFSHGERTLTPFLRSRGRSRIDVLIISHEDKDHAGGAEGLARHFAIDLIISDTQAARAIAAARHQDCRPVSFTLAAVNVSLLSPEVLPGGRIGNDGSCVVQLSHGGMSVLLPGDIEVAREARMLAKPSKLRADVLVAPHHGSLTSSSSAFIDAVSPSWALFAAGAGNRYGFPKKEIVARYQSRGINTLSSATEGQISFYFDGPPVVKTYRRDLAPFWYNRVFGVGDWPITE